MWARSSPRGRKNPRERLLLMAALPSSPGRRGRRRHPRAVAAGSDHAPLALLALLALIGLVVGGWLYYRGAARRAAAEQDQQRATAENRGTELPLVGQTGPTEHRPAAATAPLGIAPPVGSGPPVRTRPPIETAPSSDAAADTPPPPARRFDGPLPEPPADKLKGMVLVPAGPFLYGDSDQEIDLPAFYIDRLEVSQAEYAKFLEYVERSGDHSHCHPDEPEHKDHTPLAWGRPDITNPRFPVVGLDYWDVQAYSRWVGKRLPTEHEWEKAARGTDGRRYPWGDQWDADRCNWGPAGDNHRTLLPVDSLPAGESPYGCLHMLGNAAEWTASFIDEANGVHCGRGYCWRLGHMTPYVVTYRMAGQTDLRDDGSGLRCALDAPADAESGKSP